MQNHFLSVVQISLQHPTKHDPLKLRLTLSTFLSLLHHPVRDLTGSVAFLWSQCSISLKYSLKQHHLLKQIDILVDFRKQFFNRGMYKGEQQTTLSQCIYTYAPTTALSIFLRFSLEFILFKSYIHLLQWLESICSFLSSFQIVPHLFFTVVRYLLLLTCFGTLINLLLFLNYHIAKGEKKSSHPSFFKFLWNTS